MTPKRSVFPHTKSRSWLRIILIRFAFNSKRRQSIQKSFATSWVRFTATSLYRLSFLWTMQVVTLLLRPASGSKSSVCDQSTTYQDCQTATQLKSVLVSWMQTTENCGFKIWYGTLIRALIYLWERHSEWLLMMESKERANGASDFGKRRPCTKSFKTTLKVSQSLLPYCRSGADLALLECTNLAIII